MRSSLRRGGAGKAGGTEDPNLRKDLLPAYFIAVMGVINRSGTVTGGALGTGALLLPYVARLHRRSMPYLAACSIVAGQILGRATILGVVVHAGHQAFPVVELACLIGLLAAGGWLFWTQRPAAAVAVGAAELIAAVPMIDFMSRAGPGQLKYEAFLNIACGIYAVVLLCVVEWRRRTGRIYF